MKFILNLRKLMNFSFLFHIWNQNHFVLSIQLHSNTYNLTVTLIQWLNFAFFYSFSKFSNLLVTSNKMLTLFFNLFYPLFLNKFLFHWALNEYFTVKSLLQQYEFENSNKSPSVSLPCVLLNEFTLFVPNPIRNEIEMFYFLGFWIILLFDWSNHWCEWLNNIFSVFI